MSDYLQRLAAKVRTPAQTLQPRLASQFEPLPGTVAANLATTNETWSEEISTDKIDAAPPLPHSSPERGYENAPSSMLDAPADRTISSGNKTSTSVNALSQVPPSASHLLQHLVEAASEIHARTRQSIDDAPPSSQRNSIDASEPLRSRSRVMPRIEAARRRESADVSSPKEEQAPTIRVTIGRVEVRAVHPPAPTVRQAAPRKPALSLEEYAKQRRERQR